MPDDNLALPFDNGQPDVSELLGDLRRLIAEARERAAVAVNRELTLMHWHIGDRIRRDILREERAAYGERIVATLSQQLTAEFGRGYSVQNLLHLVRFAEIFPEEQILSTLSRQLGWSHFQELIYIDDRLILKAQRCVSISFALRNLARRLDKTSQVWCNVGAIPAATEPGGMADLATKDTKSTKGMRQRILPSFVSFCGLICITIGSATARRLLGEQNGQAG